MPRHDLDSLLGASFGAPANTSKPSLDSILGGGFDVPAQPQQMAQPQTMAQPQQVQQPQQVAQELSPMQEEVRGNTDNLNYTNIPEMGIIDSIKDMFTGSARETPEMTGKGMPEYGMLNMVNKDGENIGQTKAMVNDVSILGGAANQAKYESSTFTMTNANEKAQVAVEINPDLEIRYNKDKRGNVYPILTNTKTGESSMVMMPGLGADDVVNSLSTAGLFLINPFQKAKLVSQVVNAVGTEAAIQAKDAAVGGEFNATEVGVSAGGAVLGQGATVLAKKILGRLKPPKTTTPDANVPYSPDGAAKFRGHKRQWELTEAQRAKVENYKQGFDSAKAKLTDADKEAQMRIALSSGDMEKVIAMSEIDEVYMKALKDLGIEEAGTPLSRTTNKPGYKVEQGLKQVPGSELAEKEILIVEAVAKKADDLIKEHGGDLTKSNVDIKIAGRMQDSIKDLGEKSEKVYTSITKAITEKSNGTAKSTMDNVGGYLTKELDELHGDITQLTPLQKQLKKMYDDGGASYKAIDNIRKRVGEKLGNAMSQLYGSEDKRTLSKLYGLLTDDQYKVAERYGMGEAWDVAKDMTVQQKTLENNTQILFGSKLKDALMPKLETSMKALGTTGNYKKFFEIVDAIPKKDRQEAIISALNGVFTMGSRKEKQLSIPGFADWYNGLKRDKRLMGVFKQYLPRELSKSLDDMGKVTNKLRTVMSSKPVGGQLMATPGLLNGVMRGIADKVLVKAIGRIPGFGIVGDVAQAGIDKGKSKGTDKAVEMLNNPNFFKTIKAVKEGRVKAAKKLEEGFMKTNAFKAWVKDLSKQERILIAKRGFLSWLKSDEQEP